MSSDAATVVAGLIVTADVALVLACRFVQREPFVTIDRWLARAWNLIYRATGAAALDRRIDRARSRRDAAMFTDLAESLDSAGLGRPSARCRAAATESAARIR